LTCESTYLIRTSKASALDYTGHYYQCSTPIPLSPGWNWISYLPAAPLSLDDALVSLEDHGIYIKNQVSYAEYVPAWNGWFGTLTSMEPGDGHKIRMATSDTLVYPEQALVAANAGTRQRVTRLGHPGMMDWSITPSAYEYSGSVTATVTWGGQATASPGDVLAAFVDAECRGLQSAVGAPSGEYVFYLMVYSNVAHGETMSFKYFDGKAGTIDDVVPTLDFSENMTCGRAESPFQVHPATGHHPGEKAVRLETALHRIRPNPFHSGTTVSFSIKQAGHVTVQISDVRGERIKVLVDEVLVPGTYSVWWDRRNQSGQPVASGFYFCRMKTEGYTSVKKMTVLQ
jgi:hypothetical protein